jgi:hypothetical protein
MAIECDARHLPIQIIRNSVVIRCGLPSMASV